MRPARRVRAGRRNTRWEGGSARGGDRLREPGHELVEAVVAFLDAVAHAVLDHAVAIRNGLEDGMPANAATAAADVLDDDLVERDVPRVALELEGLDHVVDVQAVEHAMERPLGLIVPVDVAILAARSGVALVDHHLVMAWAEPLDDQVWLEECTVHERRRRIELPLGVDE